MSSYMQIQFALKVALFFFKWRRIIVFYTRNTNLGSFVGVFLPKMISSWDMDWLGYLGLGVLFPPNASLRLLLSFGESFGDVREGIPGEVLPPLPPMLRGGILSFWPCCPLCFINLFPPCTGLMVSPRLISLVSWKVGVLLFAELGRLECFWFDKFLLCWARISVEWKVLDVMAYFYYQSYIKLYYMYCCDMHTRYFLQIYNQNSDLLVQSHNYGIHCYLGYISIYFNNGILWLNNLWKFLMPMMSLKGTMSIFITGLSGFSTTYN